MGRSRADNNPSATSPARFLRRTRTKTPDPIPGLPSPFPASPPPSGAAIPEPQPYPGPSAPQSPVPPVTSTPPLAPPRSESAAAWTPPEWRGSNDFGAAAGRPAPAPIGDPDALTTAIRRDQVEAPAQVRPGSDRPTTRIRPRKRTPDAESSTAREAFTPPPGATDRSVRPESTSRAAGRFTGPAASSSNGYRSAAAGDAAWTAAGAGYPAPAPGSGAAGSDRKRRGSGRGASPVGGGDARGKKQKIKRSKRERATEAVREVLAPTGVGPEELAQRLPDTLRGVGEQALVAVRKWADPRERELRKRRRARRRTLRLGTASGLTTAGTVGLVLISAPAWAVIVVGGGAVALVTGAAVTTKRYLELRKEPLPQAAFVPRKLPPIRSMARASIARLVRAERALHELGEQIARTGRLPAEDLADTLETATSGAAALHALASDVVAMERASGAMGAYSPLVDHVQLISVRLDGGVAEFEGMVAAAARVLAVPESAAIADDLGMAMVNLRDAADRLDGWAQALTDLADNRFRP